MSASDTLRLTGGLLQIFGTVFVAIQARSAIGYFYGWPTLRQRFVAALRWIFRKRAALIVPVGIAGETNVGADLSIRWGQDESRMSVEDRLTYHRTWLVDLDNRVVAVRKEAKEAEGRSMARDAELRAYTDEKVGTLRTEVKHNIVASPRLAKVWFIGPLVFLVGTGFTTWPDEIASLVA